MSSAKRIIAEAILENFGSISPYVVQQLIRDIVAENMLLHHAIEDICSAHAAKDPSDFHAWFSKQVSLAKATIDGGRGVQGG